MEVNALKDSVSNICLPPGLKLSDSSQGLTCESQIAFNIVQHWAATINSVVVVANRETLAGATKFKDTAAGNKPTASQLTDCLSHQIRRYQCENITRVTHSDSGPHSEMTCE